MRTTLKLKSFSRDSVWFQSATFIASSALCVTAALIFSVQPDWCAAVLVLPRWLWIGPGLVLAFLGLTRRHRKWALIAILLWLMYAIAFVQELRSLIRWKTSPNSQRALRVISLNCNGGNESAAAEVKSYSPDLIFFEETPPRAGVKKMATNLLGPEAETLCSSDLSLIARGKVMPQPVQYAESAPFIHARVQFSSGPVAEVFVVRLLPYNIRADLWSPECWHNQCEIRKKQRAQFEWIEREVEKVPQQTPIILGGDFNLPAGDKLFQILKRRLHDTFYETGHGWGDTLDDDIPVLRIDQIWCNNRFSPVSTAAHHTNNSDHRMVVCDLVSNP